jgi:hypothetical protein
LSIRSVPTAARTPLSFTSEREAATMLTDSSTIAIWNSASAKSKFGSRSAAWSRLALNSLALARELGLFEGDAEDHLAAALPGRHRRQQLMATVSTPIPVGPYVLWPEKA